MGGVENYESLDALAMAQGVREGSIRPADLLEAAIERAERHVGIGAIPIPMFEEAREAAGTTLPDGPLRGVPFLLKDLHTARRGWRLTNGSRLFADQVSDFDSEFVSRYLRAGLLLFGRSASPEFGLTTSTESVLFGKTRNPWNPEHTAGGSSGGAAAAVAAGILPAAHASDGGGSIRIPASCCGLFGLKPTRARVPSGPRKGEGWSGMSISHAVSRSVRDSAALLDAVAGPEVGAPYWAPPQQRPFLEEVGADPGRLRIALQTQSWNGAPTDPECRRAAESTAELCVKLGHEVETAPLLLGDLELGRATQVIIGSNVRALVEEGAAALGRDARETDLEPLTWAMFQLAGAVGGVDYAHAVQTLHAAGRCVALFLERYDAILSPTMATLPTRIGELALDNPDRGALMEKLMASIGYTQLFNASGHPAMSVPMHWAPEGLPIGVQFAGRFGDEATLFRLAAQLEAARPWFTRTPPRG
ncbi:MAG: amidase [bacterium]|jgi:Asp-tRNA(Asn)/Glu-tRNA(Gln) amidotransferase A subunit family amidase|nr:hypothetical protein [Deltaproteobacteria bacterium]MCP4242665.1 amidase [bacterium]MDP7570968.1 amidase family protein [Myxococcota bacterium]